MQVRIYCVKDNSEDACLIKVDLRVAENGRVYGYWSSEEAVDSGTKLTFEPQHHALSDEAATVSSYIEDVIQGVREMIPWIMPVWFTIRDHKGFFFSGSSLNTPVEGIKFVDGASQEDQLIEFEDLWSLQSVQKILAVPVDSCWTVYEAIVRRFCETTGLIEIVFPKKIEPCKESLEKFFADNLDVSDIPEMHEQLQEFIAYLLVEKMTAEDFKTLTQADLTADPKFGQTP